MYNQTAVAAVAPRNRFLISDEQIESNREAYTMGFNFNYAELFCEKILNPIREVWYRAKFVGFENFPQRNNPDSPLIFATNHSGMAFPWDAIAFISRGIEKLKDSASSIRALISPMLTKFPNMCPYMIDGLWWKAGCINATFLNFETGMKFNQSNILIFPEGIEGIGKGFDKKYQFQPFKTSFLRMSIRYKTDIIPFYTINGEYNNPLAYNIKPLTKLCKKIGLPFFPLGPVIFLAIFQPWIFYASLPSQLTFVLGDRIKVYEMTNKPYDELTQKDLKAIGETIRMQMQQKLTELSHQYGSKYYNLRSLLKAMWTNKRHFFRYFPAFWPLSMTYFDVNYKERDGKGTIKFSLKNCFKTIFKRPIVLAMYLPVLGWLFIALKSYFMLRRRRQQNKNL
ncbi:MAG: hypothetical protein J6Z01_07340 [Bacteroidales bacterium]|nr:hypothetical protein [Bacteroidales bacterium]